MFLYVYWPHNGVRGNQTFSAFKTKTKAAEFAINQVATYMSHKKKSSSFDAAIKKARVQLFNEPQGFVGDANPAPNANDFEVFDEAAFDADPAFPAAPAIDVAPGVHIGGNEIYATRTTEKKVKVKKKLDNTSSEYLAVMKELDGAKHYKTLEVAVRVLNAYEAYLSSNGRKSVMHEIKEVKVVDETPML